MAGAKPKVLLAMSGGVDSSVAAAVLVRAGYEVVGCFMRLGTVGESLDAGACRAAPAQTEGPELGRCSPGVSASRSGHAGRGAPPTPLHAVGASATELAIKHRGCCSVSDAADARLVAAQLGIPFYVCNFKRDFGRIIDYFADEYAAGRTPNPCVRCNDWLKFGKLHDYAAELGCGYVASGHYARIVADPATGEPRLARGLDEAKDQSYVLFGVDREKLSRMLLPIGEMRKADVRALASELGLPVFDKPDSQEICFVPDDDYAGLVERRRPDLAGSRGPIVDTAGREVGEHQGQHRFTVGQRRRIGVALGRPLYVVEKRPGSNTIVIGDGRDLLVESCIIGEVNWLGGSGPRTGA
ncbi:MAG TPA: tRNA methyl transferase PRC-barrel domain-containing protein, partial [Phycisphaerales bacterium]|nr:tRNA methyl transferase PRC-barrel domain-containing protein [Phycisphaerales bacterium]